MRTIDTGGSKPKLPRQALSSAATSTSSVGLYRLVAVLGFIVISLYLVFLAQFMVGRNYNQYAGYLFAPTILVFGLPYVRRLMTKVEDDVWIRRAVMAGLVAKMLGAFARFYVNEFLIGHADAKQYFVTSSLVADEFRQLIFGGPEFQWWIPKFTGTSFMRLITSSIFTFTGNTLLGGYIIFSFLSFWGLYFFYRAFAIAMPADHRRRYVVLVFFLPSVVFWPSSIGKEAFMVFALGLGTYGVARLLTYRRFGYLLIGIASVGMGLMRPHMAAIFGAALIAAFVIRKAPDGDAGGGNIKKVVGLMVFAVAAGILVNQLEAFFGLSEGLSPQAVFDETTRRTSQGGSGFETTQPTSPAQIPWAIITVLFRPFLFEANSAASLITAIEGTVLLFLFVWNSARIVRLPALMIQHPFVGFSVMYSLMFTFAFSAISNFGILARQRTQLFPIIVIILAIPIQGAIQSRAELIAQGKRLKKTKQAADAEDDGNGDGEDDEVGGTGTEPADGLVTAGQSPESG